MRAAVCRHYGPPDVVAVEQVNAPVLRKNHALIGVYATAVTSGDARIRAARFPKGFGPFARLAFGVRGPRTPILGTAFSGVIIDLQSDSTTFALGDRVCGMTGAGLSTHAERVMRPLPSLVRVPDSVHHHDAASVLFGGTTALHHLRDKGKIRPGQRVLINGGSGAVGTNAIQLARVLGAASVTAVASEANHELLHELGAETTLDYRHIDMASLEDRFDLVYDTVGTLGPAVARDLLTPKGFAVLADATLGQMLLSRGPVKTGAAPERPSDMEQLMAYLADGSLRTVTDSVMGLDDIVAAHARVDTGHKVGNVIIDIKD